MENLRILRRLIPIHQQWSAVTSYAHRARRGNCSNLGSGRASRTALENFKIRVGSGPSFQDFIAGTPAKNPQPVTENHSDDPGYFPEEPGEGHSRRVYFETYGCQMNVNDTEIAWSILQSKGYQRTSSLSEADVVLLVTCSVREKAEQKIWNRLQQLTDMKKKRFKTNPLRVGILGCMAERLKTELLEREKLVDLLAGPDAYRDLPRLLTVAHGGQQASNVLLSLEETYADIMPVHSTPQGYGAFVSIMRGCDNMCSYCIVPFTRGRERSRPVSSILEEVRMLSDQGVKEVTLLGQNVNSYRDTSEAHFCGSDTTKLSKGFRSIYQTKRGGLRFCDLLDKVSLIDPDMRIRFTSPHPKDFPDEVLHLIAERQNICKQIHLPAQSGSSQVLKAMRRGYTREAYLDLVENVKKIIPDVSLSSDFISGFCGETENDHQQTLSLIREVGYNVAFLFAYSMRNKTHAFHRLEDDVPTEVKQRRLEECINVFREEAAKVNAALTGSTQLVLVEGESKRSNQDLCGRTDGNLKVIFPKEDLAVRFGKSGTAPINPGDYVLVKILSTNSQSLRGRAIRHSSLRDAATHCESLHIGQCAEHADFAETDGAFRQAAALAAQGQWSSCSVSFYGFSPARPSGSFKSWAEVGNNGAVFLSRAIYK